MSAATLTKGQGRDGLRYVDLGGREATTLPERAYTLSLLGPPQPLEYMSCSAYAVEYEAVVYYAASPGVEDRMADDAQAIVSSMYTVHTEADDLWSGHADAQAPTELDGALGLPLSIIIKYV